MRAALVALAACAACSAPAQPPGLVRAERLAHDGQDAEALVAYERVVATCPAEARGSDARTCRAALVGQAELLDRLGRREEAARAFEALPARLPRDPDAGASAVVAAARLRLALGQDARAYDLFWHVVVNAPETAAADDALRDVVADARRRDPRELYRVVRDLYARLAGTALGDNLLWTLARLARDDLHDDAAALADLDRLLTAHPGSPFTDDALVEGAALARAAGDPEGAARRLATLLARRETAWMMGSYLSRHMPGAQLELGRILRDDLHRPDEALAAFARVEKDYPSSRVIDDALYEIAATRAARGETAAACQALAELARRFPESRYQLEQAPRLAGRLACGPPGR